MTNHAASLRGVRSRFSLRSSKPEAQARGPNCRLARGSGSDPRFTGRCSADGFPGSRAGREAYNTGNSRRRWDRRRPGASAGLPGQPATWPSLAGAGALVAEAGTLAADARIKVTAARIAAVVAGATRQAPPGPPIRPEIKSFFACADSFDAAKIGTGPVIESSPPGKTSGEITARIQKNVKTVLQRKHGPSGAKGTLHATA